ncbi:DUF4142 domain-containing protein [Cellvibrio mixtus]|uniref:DUF4142 domain-containing protein n=1 Tax=Cellvibrio mixtus TaxID=39650 RepID=UPI000694367B|nr:DUF4142 domain-containing protein [Cellvibrio mixtus]
MKMTKYIMTSLFTVALGTCSIAAMADIDAEDFVDEAAAKNIAEIEAAKLALDKSTYPAVRTFAQKMINEHSANNTEIRSLATRKKVDVTDEAELTSKAKAAILKQRDGESFDVAYANNQVSAHKDALEFYKDAAKSKDADVRTFAVATVPKIQHHLKEAEALVSELAKNSPNVSTKAETE